MSFLLQFKLGYLPSCVHWARIWLLLVLVLRNYSLWMPDSAKGPFERGAYVIYWSLHSLLGSPNRFAAAVVALTVASVLCLLASAVDRALRWRRATRLYGAVNPAVVQRRLWTESGLTGFSPVAASARLMASVARLAAAVDAAANGSAGSARLTSRLPASATKRAPSSEATATTDDSDEDDVGHDHELLLEMAVFDVRHSKAALAGLSCAAAEAAAADGSLASHVADAIVFAIWLTNHYDYCAVDGGGNRAGPGLESLLSAACNSPSWSPSASIGAASVRAGLSPVPFDVFEFVTGLSPWRRQRRHLGLAPGHALTLELTATASAMQSRALRYELDCWTPSSAVAARPAGSDALAPARPPLAVLAAGLVAQLCLLATELSVSESAIQDAVRRRLLASLVAQRALALRKPPLGPGAPFCQPPAAETMVFATLHHQQLLPSAPAGIQNHPFGLQFHPAAPGADVRRRFHESVVSQTFCPFARSARAWLVPCPPPSASPAALAHLEEPVLAALLVGPWLRRFVAAAMDEQLQALGVEITFTDKQGKKEKTIGDEQQKMGGAIDDTRAEASDDQGAREREIASAQSTAGICASLRRFLAALTVLDGNGSGSNDGDGEAVRQQLLLRPTNRREIKCWWLDAGSPAHQAWSFEFAGQRFFVTAFAPCYGKHSSRQSMPASKKKSSASKKKETTSAASSTSSSLWILLQPEHSFPRAGVSGDEYRGSVRAKIRRAFVKAQRPYPAPEINEPASLSYIMPTPDTAGANLTNFVPVRWWLSEATRRRLRHEKQSAGAAHGTAIGSSAGPKKANKKKASDDEHSSSKKTKSPQQPANLPPAKRQPTKKSQHQRPSDPTVISSSASSSSSPLSSSSSSATAPSNAMLAADVLALLDNDDDDDDDNGGSSVGNKDRDNGSGQYDDDNDGMLMHKAQIDEFVTRTAFRPVAFRTLLDELHQLPRHDSLDKPGFRRLARLLFGGNADREMETADAAKAAQDEWQVVSRSSKDKLKKERRNQRRQSSELAGDEGAAPTMSAEELDSVLDWMFDLLDLDDSGRLEASETLLAMNMFCCGPFRERALVCFEAFDQDNSGTLDRDELHELILTTLLKSRSLLAELFEGFDSVVPLATLEARKSRHRELRGDGANRGAAGPLAKPDDSIHVFSHGDDVAQVMQLAAQAFSDADTDKSGAIDREEFFQWAQSTPIMHDFFDLHRSLFRCAVCKS